MKPIGRPPTLERIIDLEKQVNVLLNILKDQSDKIIRLESRIDRLIDQDKQVRDTYKPLFEHWVNPR